MDTPVHDYIAVIFIAGGSSWGRSPKKEDAIKICLRNFHDWESIFDLPKQEVSISVYDVEGCDTCWWDHQGMHGKSIETGAEEDIALLEIVKREFVPSRKKKRRA